MQSPNTVLCTYKAHIKHTKTLSNPRPISVPSQPRSHGSTTQACAACKYQRRKCASDCILAPYFPHDRQLDFLNAHRLFGVSNIVKIVANLNQPDKDNAMRTIIYQSNVRAADPVGGCQRIVHDLEQQINLAQVELEIVLHHLALCRAAAQQEAEAEAEAEAEVVVPLTDCGDKRWTEQYTAEQEEVAAVEDLNSWGCIHAHAESTSSSFPHDDHHDRECSLDECNDLIRPIFDHLVCDDVREDEFEFDSDGNIIPRNITITSEEKAHECVSYVEDHRDLKAAATFFSLTNCDL